MYISKFSCALFVAVLCFSCLSLASAQEAQTDNKTGYWNLPLNLTPNNSEITFEIDSTWHLVKANVREIKGSVWLKDPKDYASVQAKISLPVQSFDTNNESRDEKMRRVMAETEYPFVEFNLSKAANICAPEQVEKDLTCNLQLEGELSIKGVKKQITFPAQLRKTEIGYQISAHAQLDWSDFGVEDPSILIAKVEKIVEISILLKL